MTAERDPKSLHEAAYLGRLDLVEELLASGSSPNSRADAGERRWITCAGDQPRPLNCVAVAWAMTESHVKIASLLIEHGALVDDTVLRDHAAESADGPNDHALRRVLAAAQDNRVR